ncbi:MAG: hypothetical protein IT204_09055 [Fimbriimonadaceae bacterium]|nr:hypothetical protein [Fimbriimonadaceae bacterium]
MRKLLLLLVVLGVLGGGGYYAYTVLQPPPPPAEPPAAPAATPAGDVAPAASAPAAAPPTVQALPQLECELALPAGWSIAEDAPETRVVPGGQAVVLRQGAAALPLVVVGRISPAVLGNVDPQTFPTKFITGLKKRLAKLTPPATVTAEGAPSSLPKLFAAAEQLVASGSFPDLQVTQGSGRFVVGSTAGGSLYLVVAFAAEGSPEAAAVETLIASLAPLTPAVPAEAPPAAGPAASGEPAAPAASGPAEAAPEAPVANPPTAAPPGADEPAAAPAKEPAPAAPAAKEPARGAAPKGQPKPGAATAPPEAGQSKPPAAAAKGAPGA